MALILRIGILNLGRTTISKSLFILPERSLPFSHRLVSLSATTATTDDDDASSVRAKFKEVPINSSVLEYIQRLRIGRPKKSQKRRRKKSQPRSDVLSLQEEKERFRSSKRFPSTSPPPPFPSTLDDKTDSRKTIKRYPVKLLGSIGSSDEEFPKETPGLPEVAIAGRSNVGKSTLLNALLYGEEKLEDEDGHSQKRIRFASRRTAKLPKGLKAATSARPGETRCLSFYQLSAKVDAKKISLLLVDLPGYGFAYASQTQANQWQSLMETYILNGRKSLKRILLLIDSRHGMKKADIDFLESLQSLLLCKKTDLKSHKKRELPPIQIVLTKCDLVGQTDLARRVITVRQQLSDSLIRQPSDLPIMLVSAQIEGQAGVLELQKELAGIASGGSQ